MQGLLLSSRCRSIRISSALESIGHRFRSGPPAKKRVFQPPSGPRRPGPEGGGYGFKYPSQSKGPERESGRPGLVAHNPLEGLDGVGVNASPHDILEYFHRTLPRWIARRDTLDRLISFGAPSTEAQTLLAAFAQDADTGLFDSIAALEKYDIYRFRDTDPLEADIAFSNVFFCWLNARGVIPGVKPPTVSTLRRISQAAECMHPAEIYPNARKMRRKIIMHVGPTNSGKTHNALRALASAKVGVYCGPLRLLAYEIWERLNLGQIVPLGATEEQIAEAAKIGLSVESPFARPCNMLTGEEQKIVAETATLHSCTVEMLQITTRYNVAVVDEIQMIADQERGAGWTRAVLGIRAEEVHLCGEETAVPLIKELLKDTGDELVVNRYERLTPLEIEETSLEGDLSRVRKGDCIVTFSRASIFHLKRQVESKAKLKCAVVYGKLPPEIRSEQAALFNDPDSGYDVLIGSDAIGMGLNLKIRRVIFEAIAKFNGVYMAPLSVSQMKQIAGRAGRFGMQSVDEKPGGFVTTLQSQDLPELRKALPQVIPPLAYARVSADRDIFGRMVGVLPANATTETVYTAYMHAARMAPAARVGFPHKLKSISEFMDEHGQFTLEDRLLFVQAPFPWLDQQGLHAIAEFVVAYRDTMNVDLMATLANLPYLGVLEDGEAAMRETGSNTFNPSAKLITLEFFHKILVAYLWLSYRNPVSYSSYEEAVELKERLELVLHWSLQQITRFDRGERPAAGVRRKAPIEFKSEREFKDVQVAIKNERKKSPSPPALPAPRPSWN